MRSRRRRSRVRYLVLLIGMIIPVGLSLLADSPATTFAQQVSVPIARHTVLHWAYRYLTYEYNYGGTHYTHFPYCYGYADSVAYLDEPGHGACNVCCEYFSSRLSSNCDPIGCQPPACNAGTDCSGFVTRVWGRPIREKYGTCTIPDHAVRVPYSGRGNDLPRRMRMGDVFNDCSNHVVLLYYFDPRTGQPHYYESTCFYGATSYDGVRIHSGWDYIEGYAPYRYRASTDPSDNGFIQDDLYLPWLSHEWYGWESTLFARNNQKTAPSSDYVLQHTIYRNVGGDQNAINNKTYVRQGLSNDLMELPTYILNPGTFYLGGGVVAADAGTGGVVYIENTAGTGGPALAYTGITPFSDLGMATANTLYMPVFQYSAGGAGYLSKIFVQNAGKMDTRVTATYYGDDGRTCSNPSVSLAPWGTAILQADQCWVAPSTPPASGSVVLTGSNGQPLAAMTYQHNNWTRVGAFNGFSAGSTSLYTPVLLRAYYGWNSTLHLQNLGTGPANVTVSYYTHGGGFICSDRRSISANRHVAIDHGGSNTCIWNRGYNLFAAVVSTTSNQPLVAAVSEDNGSGVAMQSYNAAIRGERGLVAPYVRRGIHSDGEPWAASIVVQNTTGWSNNRVDLHFYNQAGGYVTSRSCLLGPRASCVKYTDDLPNPFSGSVAIEADYAVAAVISVVHTDIVDGSGSYLAIEQKGIAALELGGEGAMEE